jgi:magnesium transporter
VSVHRLACQRFDRMREQLQREPPKTEHELVFRVIDALTDSVLDVLDDVAEIVDEHESLVFDRPRAGDRDRMAVLRRSLGSLRRVLVIQRQGFERMVERINELPGLTGDAGSYWRDVGDHLWRALDETEATRDSLQGILENYTNEVQERLTIVATIFLPLTVLTGFFGQNFNWLIDHIGSAWTFWGIGVGGLIVSAGGIMFWLVKSGLYQGPGVARHRPRVPRPLRRRRA